MNSLSDAVYLKKLKSSAHYLLGLKPEQEVDLSRLTVAKVFDGYGEKV